MANVLIEVATGKVVAWGEEDFSQDPRYDASVHNITTYPDTDLIPFDPRHNDQYHKWDGSNYVLEDATEEEKEHSRHSVGEEDFQDLLKEHLAEGAGISITQNAEGKLVVSLS